MKCPCCNAELALHVVAPLGEQKRRPDGGREPADMTSERAANFTMPFGKYRGRTLADIGEQDIGYLRWGAKEWDRTLGRAVRFHLDQVDSMGPAERR